MCSQKGLLAFLFQRKAKTSFGFACKIKSLLIALILAVQPWTAAPEFFCETILLVAAKGKELDRLRPGLIDTRPG